ncbi:helix-turn-helix domain-containing protein [Flagellimonas sp.]|jgi:AraC-like DNA-binding protein|uniref:helix-turn-helix domain-containing protein n=1 Tax=Flagellimonas sp. TaxID=2058762 RepID=UPI003BAA6EB8
MKVHILIFLCFGAAGILMTILFAFKKSNDSFSNRILGLYVLLYSIEIFYNCIKWLGLLNSSPWVHFNLIAFPFWTLYGPLIFIYVRRIVTGKGISTKDVLHLIPVLLVVITLSPFYMLDTSDKIEILRSTGPLAHTWFPSWGIWLFSLHLFSYAAVTYVKFKNAASLGYQQRLWLKWLLGSYFSFSILFFAFLFLLSFGIVPPHYDYFIDLGIVTTVSVTTYFGFMQPDIFRGRPFREILPLAKYRKSGLDKATALDLKSRLDILMQENKLYKEPDLRLDDLSKQLHTSRNHISQVINEEFNKNFFEFVNSYRVEEAIDLLQEEENQKITDILYDVGFNNRSSFYKAFKKSTGYNPSEYLQKF